MITSRPSKIQTGFCSPSSTRSFGATPFARKSCKVSLTYCSGFLFVAGVPNSLMFLLPKLRDFCGSSVVAEVKSVLQARYRAI